jgi:hypothetical protein
MTPDTASPSAARGEESKAALLVLAGAVACAAGILLILQSHLTFLADDWRFLLQRRGFNTGVFLRPHTDHIVLAPVAIYKTLLAIFGMSSALPFQMVSTFVYLLSATVLFVYLRTRVGDWLALLASCLILFLGAAWFDLLRPFQIVFSGSIAAGIGAFLALDRDDRKGDLLACVLLAVATAFSELGVPFAIGALVSVALGPQPRLRRIYVPLVPVVLYGAWYLGWGHEGIKTANFHNLVHSPRFVFDAVSQNLASLLGLATPLSGDGSSLVGLNSGRILLVGAIALVIWRLWRTGRPSRGLWTVLATGGAFWFLTALNAYPVFRSPTSGRYQYPGAVFVLLIAAELLRGVRLGRRTLIAATVVTIAAVLSGLVFLQKGYRLSRTAGDLERAKLAAVEIGRGQVRPDFVIAFDFLTVVDARAYFSAVDDFGSPAFDESELENSPDGDRIAADQMLVSAEQIKLQPLAPGAGTVREGACRTVTGSPPSATPLALSPGSYTLRARPARSTSVQLARFADGPSVNLGALRPGSASFVSLPTDGSTRPWRLFSAGPSEILVCDRQ